MGGQKEAPEPFPGGAHPGGCKDHSFKAGLNGTSCFKEKSFIMERALTAAPAGGRGKYKVNQGMQFYFLLRYKLGLKILGACASRHSQFLEMD